MYFRRYVSTLVFVWIAYIAYWKWRLISHTFMKVPCVVTIRYITCWFTDNHHLLYLSITHSSGLAGPQTVRFGTPADEANGAACSGHFISHVTPRSLLPGTSRGTWLCVIKKKLHGLRPRANYTDSNRRLSAKWLPTFSSSSSSSSSSSVCGVDDAIGHTSICSTNGIVPTCLTSDGVKNLFFPVASPTENSRQLLA
jgi:hypothetical protein